MKLLFFRCDNGVMVMFFNESLCFRNSYSNTYKLNVLIIGFKKSEAKVGS